MGNESGTTNGHARTLEDIKRQHVMAVLAKNGGKFDKTAVELDVAINTLYRWVKDWRKAGLT